MAARVRPRGSRWRCAYGKHPYPSRTRWLRRKRPRILCRGRHGKAGGCRGLQKKACTLKTSYRTEWWKHKRCGNQDNRETNKQEQAVNKKTGLFLPRKGKSGCNAMQPRKVKQRKAQGGCLGTKGRRKTRQAAKSCGEGHMPSDPQVSEWGNPHRAHPVYPCVNT